MITKKRMNDERNKYLEYIRMQLIESYSYDAFVILVN